MHDQQRRDDAPPYNQTMSGKARHDLPREYDDPSRRQDKALGQERQLTAREREERWPIG